MAHEQAFWPRDCGEGEPDLLVCMSCLNEVFRQKVPMPDCPSCHGVSTYEPFTMDSIQDWGTEELIAKAQEAQKDVVLPPVQTEEFPVVEAPTE